MNLHSLMNRFAALEGAEVARGPKHHQSPVATLTTEIAAFLAAYPFLQHDPEYVTFLESYAGAYCITSDRSIIIDIFGFSTVSAHMVNMDGEIVTEDGYLIFAYILLDETREIDFAFDATGERRWGIYRASGEDLPWHWYCATFTQWLSAMLEKKGRLL